MISSDPTDFPETAGDVAGRAMLVRAARPVRLECVVRGYLFGGGWQEYQERGHGRRLRGARGLRQAERLPEPLFTPTTKAEAGHDLPLTRAEAIELVGAERYERCATSRSRLYEFGAALARRRGVILADTKFEFGELDERDPRHRRDDDARLVALLAGRRVRGRHVAAVVRQAVRARLHGRTGWDHEPPAPHMPPEVIANTRRAYREAYELITGASLDDWFGPDDA